MQIYAWSFLHDTAFDYAYTIIHVIQCTAQCTWYQYMRVSSRDTKKMGVHLGLLRYNSNHMECIAWRQYNPLLSGNQIGLKIPPQSWQSSKALQSHRLTIKDTGQTLEEIPETKQHKATNSRPYAALGPPKIWLIDVDSSSHMLISSVLTSATSWGIPQHHHTGAGLRRRAAGWVDHAR